MADPLLTAMAAPRAIELPHLRAGEDEAVLLDFGPLPRKRPPQRLHLALWVLGGLQLLSAALAVAALALATRRPATAQLSQHVPVRRIAFGSCTQRFANAASSSLDDTFIKASGGARGNVA